MNNKERDERPDQEGAQAESEICRSAVPCDIPGHQRQVIFRSGTARQCFIWAVWGSIASATGSIYAQVLMSNHGRLLIETGRVALSKNKSFSMKTLVLLLIYEKIIAILSHP